MLCRGVEYVALCAPGRRSRLGYRAILSVMNFNAAPVRVDLGDAIYTDLLTGVQVKGEVELDVYGVMVLPSKRVMASEEGR